MRIAAKRGGGESEVRIAELGEEIGATGVIVSTIMRRNARAKGAVRVAPPHLHEFRRNLPKTLFLDCHGMSSRCPTIKPCWSGGRVSEACAIFFNNFGSRWPLCFHD